MKDKIFLDTNILLYTYSSTEPIKQQKAIALINQATAIISTQVLKEFSNVLSRKFNVGWTDIETALDELTRNFQIHTNDSNSIKKACQIANRYQFSFYDSLIITAALESGCSILYLFICYFCYYVGMVG